MKVITKRALPQTMIWPKEKRGDPNSQAGDVVGYSLAIMKSSSLCIIGESWDGSILIEAGGSLQPNQNGSFQALLSSQTGQEIAGNDTAMTNWWANQPST